MDWVPLAAKRRRSRALPHQLRSWHVRVPLLWVVGAVGCGLFVLAHNRVCKQTILCRCVLVSRHEDLDPEWSSGSRLCR